jgi:hypothetical protein
MVRTRRIAGSVLLASTLAVPAGEVVAQGVPRILEQDSSLDNLVDPPGYQTSPLGTLGAIRRVGTGPRAMVLVPGLGFGAEVFEPLMADFEDQFTMFAVTLPGSGRVVGATHEPALRVERASEITLPTATTRSRSTIDTVNHERSSAVRIRSSVWPSSSVHPVVWISSR